MRIDCGDAEIRSYRATDVVALQRHADNPNVAAHLRDRFPSPYGEADARQWISVAMRQDLETNFAIAVGDELVGTVGLQLGEDVYRHSAEIGYWLAETYWGRGIVTRVVRELTNWAFEEIGLLRVHAYVFDGNPASMRVLEKAGYRFEARMRHAVVKNGRVMDQLLFARLVSDRLEQVSGESE